jgi:hypothetical protein
VLNHDNKETTMITPAKPKQLSYLRGLAAKTGTSFTHPKTSTEASAEIKRLLGLNASKRRRVQDTDFTGDTRATAYGTAQQPGEAYGYGSTASWQRPLRVDIITNPPVAKTSC